jgi:hypothetical protein
MVLMSSYNVGVSERAQEKALSRQADEQALSHGEKSVEQLRRENGHFAGMKVRVDFKPTFRRSRS